MNWQNILFFEKIDPGYTVRAALAGQVYFNPVSITDMNNR